MDRIIVRKKSLIVAADVLTINDLSLLTQAMSGVAGIGGVKLGFTTAMQGLLVATKIVRQNMPGVAIIYDPQKGGTDIPETGAGFAKVVSNSGVDAVILFPFAGPATQEAWTQACFDEGLQVITGGVMTHPKFLVSEGGYIADEAVERIYRNACNFGCSHFVVPGTKEIEWVKRIRALLVEELGEGNFVLYAPGFINQGGDISECGQAAGDEWHAIVGSAIYKQPTAHGMRNAALTITRQIIDT